MTTTRLRLGASSRRPTHMLTGGTFAIVAGILVLGGCGNEQPAAESPSGVTGLVHLGPQCPVEIAGEPCADQPAADVPVTVSEQIPGESNAAGKVVARGTTNADGIFRIAVAPGDYVVTAEAGMFCELMDARVSERDYTSVDIPCDTGIR